MLTCREVAELATDYLEHDLGLVQRAKFRLHTFMCANCRRYVDQLARTVVLLRAVGTTNITKETEDALMKLVDPQRGTKFRRRMSPMD